MGMGHDLWCGLVICSQVGGCLAKLSIPRTFPSKVSSAIILMTFMRSSAGGGVWLLLMVYSLLLGLGLGDAGVPVSSSGILGHGPQQSEGWVHPPGWTQVSYLHPPSPWAGLSPNHPSHPLLLRASSSFLMGGHLFLTQGCTVGALAGPPPPPPATSDRRWCIGC